MVRSLLATVSHKWVNIAYFGIVKLPDLLDQKELILLRG